MKTSRIGRSTVFTSSFYGFYVGAFNVKAFDALAGYLRAAPERVKWRFTPRMVDTK
jgi:hypothetical protein